MGRGSRGSPAGRRPSRSWRWTGCAAGGPGQRAGWATGHATCVSARSAPGAGHGRTGSAGRSWGASGPGANPPPCPPSGCGSCDIRGRGQAGLGTRRGRGRGRRQGKRAPPGSREAAETHRRAELRAVGAGSGGDPGRVTPRRQTCSRSFEVKLLSCVQLFCDPMDCSPPGSSVHGFPRQNTGVGCHVLLQGIFLTQGSNPGLPRCRWTLYCLSPQGSRCFRGVLRKPPRARSLRSPGRPEDSPRYSGSSRELPPPGPEREKMLVRVPLRPGPPRLGRAARPATPERIRGTAQTESGIWRRCRRETLRTPCSGRQTAG